MQILTILMSVVILVMASYYMRLLPDTKPGEYILLGILITYTWSLLADIDLALKDIDMLGILAMYPVRGVIYKIPMTVGLAYAIHARRKERDAQRGNIDKHLDRGSNTSLSGHNHRHIHGLDKVRGNAATPHGA